MPDNSDAGSPTMRLTDLQLTVDLLVDASVNQDGARDRVAARNGIQKSVITDRVKRIENFFGVSLFGGPQRKEPTKAGHFMARYGPRLISEIEDFSQMIRDEASGD
ncbi:LysR family transcriptional regulator [Sinorhizobium meliloti]|uniref:LysR family transcriptional regulator n=1 Tax=Rhizobium meliloti TaxID=382 RepID=UPI00299E133B|nr:LysR family transcriptional regulator [Sinorhizobium meliloti]MDX0032277.1 LysR family transcriptional regulator [Sinorhizobium meliloti]